MNWPASSNIFDISCSSFAINIAIVYDSHNAYIVGSPELKFDNMLRAHFATGNRVLIVCSIDSAIGAPMGRAPSVFYGSGPLRSPWGGGGGYFRERAHRCYATAHNPKIACMAYTIFRNFNFVFMCALLRNFIVFYYVSTDERRRGE